MGGAAIRIRELSKQYRIGEGLTGKDRLTEAIWERIRPSTGRKGRSRADNSPEEKNIWALRNVSLDIIEGQAVGIIGRNGAGKTTLLKILSRITEPTIGFAEMHGKLASLLEVGTGFHPELTGRENIYLNGAILGMRRSEIDRKFDEIVAFSEVERFIDTPVKWYSSGMYVRLAFAVAAHLDTDILVVDEVLAVGDAPFQRKCLGEMDNAARSGRTVLFVSHNMSAIRRLCDRAIWLDSGQVTAMGSSEEVVTAYLRTLETLSATIDLPPDATLPMRLRHVVVQNPDGHETSSVEMGEPFRIRVVYDVNRPTKGAHVICFIHNSEGVNVLGTGDADCHPERLGTRTSGSYIGEFEIPSFLLGEGRYNLSVSLGVPFREVYDRHENVASFEVVDNSSIRRQWQHQRRPGILGLEIPWKVGRTGDLHLD